MQKKCLTQCIIELWQRWESKSMGEKKYEVVDYLNRVIASGMTLELALLFMKAYCQEYYMECVTLTLRDMATCKPFEKGE